MKLYLLVILFACFVLVAIFVYFYFSIRYRLYKDLVFMCKYFKNNISFNKNDVKTIMDSCMEKISLTSRNILNSNTDKLNKYIKSDDRKNIVDFIHSLGKGDVDFEINNLSYYESIFESCEIESKQNLEKNGIMYFKLIIAVGLIVCILLI